MSPASHMVGRLRKLYGIVWNRMRSLNERALHPPVGRWSCCALEQLEPRLLLSADLMVQSITAPTTVLAGEEVEVVWRVENNGADPASAPWGWSDELWYSQDATLDPEIDQYLDYHSQWSDLGAGEHYDVTVWPTLSGVPAGAGHLFVVTDAYGNVEESDEDNNRQSVGITVTIPNVDLRVTSSTGPATASPGETVNLSWTVLNDGSDTAPGGWFDSVYVSTDTTLSVDDVDVWTEGGQQYLYREGPVTGGASYTASGGFEISTEAPTGDVYLLFAADTRRSFGEGGELGTSSPQGFTGDQTETDDGNNVLAREIEIVAPDVDLAVIEADAPETADAGGEITVSWLVQNQGSAATTSDGWLDAVYHSDDASFDPWDERLDYTWNETALAAGGTYGVSEFNLSLPTDLPAGEGFLLFVTDDNNDQAETDETDNAYAVGITILPPDVDLTVFAATAPDSVAPGESISVSWTVKNVGTIGTDNYTWRDEVYFSTDATLDGEDEYMTGRTRYGDLSGGSSYTRSGISASVPESAPAGMGYLLFVTDVYEAQGESNEGNNVRAVEITVAGADLTVTSATAPATAGPGQSIDLEWTIRNDGPGDAAGRYEAVYLSADGGLDAGDLELTEFYTGTPLASGATQTYAKTVYLADPLPVGGNYQFLFVTDSRNHVAETDETDNNLARAVTIEGADLHVTAASATPGTVTPGSTVQVSHTVDNAGNAAAAGTFSGVQGEDGWYDRWYLSDDAIFDAGDTALTSEWAGAYAPLAAGASYIINSSVILPTSTVPGTRFLLAVADADDMQAEAGIQPNVHAVEINVEGADFEVTGATVVSTLVIGDEVSVDWTVLNDGSAAADSLWYDCVYLSEDATLGFGDTPLATWINQSAQRPLAVGSSYTTPATITVPQETSGAYYLLFAADRPHFTHDGYLGEADEANNVLAVGVTLVAPNLDVTAAIAPAEAAANETIAVSWTVENTGSAPAPADWSDAVYLSSDAAWDTGDTRIADEAIAAETPLAAGGSYVINRSVMLPAASEGSYYLIFKVDADEDQGETDENDNTYSLAITLGTADLEMTAATSPATGGIGETIGVSWTVENPSDRTAEGDWHDAIYVSTDDQLGAGDVLVHEEGIAAQTPLAPGAGYTVALDARLPNFTPGSAYLLFVANHLDEQAESDPDNNVIARAITLTGPDLVPTGATSPAEAAVNQTIDVSWTVANQGDSPAGETWYDGVFLSDDDQLDPSDAALLSWNQSSNSPLAVGADYSSAWQVTLPGDRTGSMYLLFGADRHATAGIDDRQAETDESNNVLTRPITVSAPDLEVTVGSAPATLVMGQPTSVTYTVTNIGSVTAWGNWQDTIVLSDDTTYEWLADSQIGGYSAASETPLAPGESYTATVDATVNANDADPGDSKYLIFISDRQNTQGESDETNNEYLLPGTVSIVAPDLVLETASGPASAVLGGEIDVSWTVRNAGAYAAGASWTDTVYLSDTPDLSGSYQVIGGEPAGADSPLAAGNNYVRTLTLDLPDFPTGSQYLVFKTDRFIDQPETDKSNNLHAIPIALTAANLEVRNVTTDPASGIQSGNEVAVRWEVHNTGDAATPKGFYDSLVVLNTSTGLTLHDTGSYYDPDAYGNAPIAPGAFIERELTYTLPDGPAGVGDIQVTVTADAGLAIPEYLAGAAAENDNDAVFAFGSTLAPYPDLAVTDITAPATILSGQEAQISWTVTNLGDRETGQTGDGTLGWRDRVYFSDDPVVGDDEYVGTYFYQGTLAPGASLTRTQAVELDIDFSGNVYVIVVTDAWGHHYEHDEANNTVVDNAAMNVDLAPMPNLVVTEIIPPSTPLSGQEAVIQWTVTNTGNGATGTQAWSDQLWLSTDDELVTFRDVHLGTVDHFSDLDPGESYVDTATVQLPDEAVGPYYFLVWSDYEDRVYEYELEDDNLLAKPVDIGLSPPADLQVTDLTVSGAAFSGTWGEVTYTVKNLGTGPTGDRSWFDAVYVSDDAVLDPQDLRLRSHRRSGSQLPAGGEYESTTHFRLPVDWSGPTWFIVQTDDALDVFEYGAEGNNWRAGNERNVTLVASDLTVAEIDFPDTVVAGRKVALTYRVDNIGLAPIRANSWRDAVYLSADPSLDAGDLQLDTFLRTEPIDAGESGQLIETVEIPDDVSGSLYLLVHTDATDREFELDGTNNITPQAITVVDLHADLQISQVGVSGVLEAGDTIPVSITTVNAGAGKVNDENWHNAVYLSTDDTLGHTDRLLVATPYAAPNLAPSDVSSLLAYATVPWEVNPGDYFLLVEADEANNVYEGVDEANNVTAVPVTVTRQTADLIVTDIQAPATATAGGTMQVTWTVRNDGPAATSSHHWYDAISLSTTPETGSGSYLARYQHGGALQPGESYTVTVDVPIEENTQGTYFVQVYTDSYSDQVLELPTNLNNQSVRTEATVISLPATPDLEALELTVPATGVAGQDITPAWSVRNNGAALSDEDSWYDAVYLSLDEQLETTEDILLGYLVLSGTGSGGGGAVYDIAHTMQIPAGLSGTYYALLYTDVHSPQQGIVSQVTERDAETNNTVAATAPIVITLPPPVDLVAGTLTVPASAIGGEEVSLTYTVTNDSATDAEGYWDDVLYASDDDQWDIDDVLIGRVQHMHGVEAGQSYTETFTGPLPGLLPGMYTVIVRSDIANRIPEAHEANNVSASLDAVDVDFPTLYLGAPQTVEIPSGATRYWRVETAPGQTVEVLADSVSDLGETGLYVRLDTVPTTAIHDYSPEYPFGSDKRVVIPRTTTSDYYIMVQAVTAPQGAEFTISANALVFGVESASPGTVGNAGPSTLEITGTKLTEDALFQLVDAGGQVAATASAVYFTDSTEVYATFDFTGLAEGEYALRATGPAGELSELAGAVTVAAGTGGDLRVALAFPPEVRYGPFSIPLEYENTGDADLLAPLLELTGPAGIAFGLQAGRTDATDTIRFLGYSPTGPAGILRPGQKVRLEFFCDAYDPGAYDFELTSIVADPTDPTPEVLSWGEFGRQNLPSWVDGAGWDALWRILAVDAGGSLYEYSAQMAGHLTENPYDGEVPNILVDDWMADAMSDAAGRGGGLLDATPPFTMTHLPEDDPAGVSYVELVFSETMDSETLTADDLILSGPGGTPITGLSVTEVRQRLYRVEFPTQTAPGAYRLTVGPDVADTVGYLLDGDQDGTGGEASDGYVGAFTIGADGRLARDLFVVGMVPGGQVDERAGADEVLLTLSNAIFAQTFTPADVSLVGPEGPILAAGVERVSPTLWQVTFPRADARGTYTITVGPDIAGLDASLMDSDGDGTPGEPGEDAFVGTFEIADLRGPRAIAHTPDDYMGEAVGEMTIAFDEPVNPASLTVSDVTITGPAGGIAPLGVEAVSDTELRVTFSPQTDGGEYAVEIAPVVTDLPGNVMDQDDDGNGGEAGEDAYTATFRIYTGLTDPLEQPLGGALAKLSAAGDPGDIQPLEEHGWYKMSIRGKVEYTGDPAYYFPNGANVTVMLWEVDGVRDDFIEGPQLGDDVEDDLVDWVMTEPDGSFVFERDYTGRSIANRDRPWLNLGGEGEVHELAEYYIVAMPRNEHAFVFDGPSLTQADPGDITNMPWLTGLHPEGHGPWAVETDWAEMYYVPLQQATALIPEPTHTEEFRVYENVTVSVADAEFLQAEFVNWCADKLQLASPTGDAPRAIIGLGTPGESIPPSGFGADNAFFSDDDLIGIGSLKASHPGSAVFHEYGHALHLAANNYLPHPYTDGTPYGMIQQSPHMDTTFAEAWASFVGAWFQDLWENETGIAMRGNTLEVNRSAQFLESNNFWMGYDAYDYDNNAQASDTKIRSQQLAERFERDGLNSDAGLFGIAGQYVMGGMMSIFWDLVDGTAGGGDDDGVSDLAGMWEAFQAEAGQSDLSDFHGEYTGTVRPNGTAMHRAIQSVFIDHGYGYYDDEFARPHSPKELTQEEVAEVWQQDGLVIAGTDPGAMDTFYFNLDEVSNADGFFNVNAMVEFDGDLGDLDVSLYVDSRSDHSSFEKEVEDIEVGRDTAGVSMSFDAGAAYHVQVRVFGHGSRKDGQPWVGGDTHPSYKLTIGAGIPESRDASVSPPPDPNDDDSDSGTLLIRTPWDPNDILGPAGYGDDNWIPAADPLDYRIRFENQETAGAWAREVTIEQFLDEDLDWRTFRLGDFGFGPYHFDVPDNRAYYQERLNLLDEYGCYVDVVAGIDVATGRAFWTLSAVDPETGRLPEGVSEGFLPQNDDENIGEGYVTYRIGTPDDATTGTRVDAEASIIFDDNLPILTPAIFHTLDAEAPASAVTSLPALLQESFTVSWDADDNNGSAVADVDVYVSDNGGDFQRWLAGTTALSAEFAGQAGHTYRFYTVAADNVGGVEPAPTQPDAMTLVQPATVAGQHIFYNNSAWDGNDPAAGAADDTAIATDKSALLPGDAATFANYTSYSRGINGIMVDIANLANPYGLTLENIASYFTFKIGNANNPEGWGLAPAPSGVLVRGGAGESESDRVTVIWADNVIQKNWLQVTVLANGNTGLAADDVFYFGNSIGETGDSGSNAFVDGTDFVGVRDNPHNFLDRAPVDDAYDINRDSFVDGTDLVLVRDNNTNFLTALKLIAAPDLPAGGAEQMLVLSLAAEPMVLSVEVEEPSPTLEAAPEEADVVLAVPTATASEPPMASDGVVAGDGSSDALLADRLRPEITAQATSERPRAATLATPVTQRPWQGLFETVSVLDGVTIEPRKPAVGKRELLVPQRQQTASLLTVHTQEMAQRGLALHARPLRTADATDATLGNRWWSTRSSLDLLQDVEDEDLLVDVLRLIPTDHAK